LEKRLSECTCDQVSPDDPECEHCGDVLPPDTRRVVVCLDCWQKREAIVAKLPKTKDGVSVGLGDVVWHFVDEWKPFPVVGNPDKYIVDLGFSLQEQVSECYSTRAAAEAARKAEKARHADE